ncbi:MAG TPA: outer membrane lipoprotein carrier protein LolA [Kofleriaceae bacterium]|jgi:outer membrane lipoprotein carrier protein
MKLSMIFLAVALAGASPVAAQPAPAAPSSPNAIVDQVQKFYANINQVTADFQQSVHNAQFGTDKTSAGTVWLKKPGKMRWDYLEQKAGKTLLKKSFISNGTTLFDVEPDNKQVIKKNLTNDVMPVAVSFLYGKGDLKAEFNAQLDTTGGYGEKGDYVLKLTPKQASAQYKNLYLVVDPKDFHAKESIIVDSSNNVNHFQFHRPDFEKPIKDSAFEFDQRAVPSYQIIDADQPQKPKP